MISETKKWFEVAAPIPTDTSRSVQTGCHFEEVAEMLESLNSGSDILNMHIKSAIISLENVSDKLKFNHAPVKPRCPVEHLDSLCDQIVTAVGVAHMYGYDIVGALAEVNRSNFSKFQNGEPIFNEHGKIAKGADYTPPNLSGFVKDE